MHGSARAKSTLVVGEADRPSEVICTASNSSARHQQSAFWLVLPSKDACRLKNERGGPKAAPRVDRNQDPLVISSGPVSASLSLAGRPSSSECRGSGRARY